MIDKLNALFLRGFKSAQAESIFIANVYLRVLNYFSLRNGLDKVSETILPRGLIKLS